jgi:shikimate kinase
VLISLIGLPGGGKSTVGRQLARRLQVAFADSDAVIEQRLSMSVRDVFERNGEAYFRDIEQRVIAELSSNLNGVLATGGGVVLAPANREVLRQRSIVVYLRATPHELFRRLRKDHSKRPLLRADDPLARLRELYLQRDPLYRQTAHFTIETGRPSVTTLVNMILMQLELAGSIGAACVPSPIDGGLVER